MKIEESEKQIRFWVRLLLFRQKPDRSNAFALSWGDPDRLTDEKYQRKPGRRVI